MTDEPAAEIVASVGALDETVALLRDFLHSSGALRVVAVVEREPGEPPAVVDCERFAPVEVDLGDRTVHLPHELELGVTPPALPEIRRLPPFEVDAAGGEVVGAIGGLEHLVDVVGALADLLGGRNVAMVVFETTDPEAPLAITARAGGVEAPVVSIGEEEFELG
ncbi:MAG TPA: hypothetical protein VMT10_11170 [Solirubrobacteraceae bacterium]|nr:hypothetical protein [Solirubrobacteraceae bacterium]